MKQDTLSKYKFTVNERPKSSAKDLALMEELDSTMKDLLWTRVKAREAMAGRDDSVFGIKQDYLNLKNRT